MCELFFMKNKDGEQIPRHRIRDLIDTAIEGSYSNSDGFGVFNSDGVIMKSEEPLHDQIPNHVVNEILGSSEVVIHLRMATTGHVCEKNAHPFSHDGRVMSHNGVLRRTDSFDDLHDNPTDSEQFLRMITEQEQGDSVENIEKAAEQVKGSASIFFRNKNSDRLLYFRHRSNFTFAETVKEIIGTTKEKRLDFMDKISQHGLYSVYNRSTPENGQIYEIKQVNGRTRLVEQAEFDWGSDVSYGGRGGNYRTTYRSGYSRDGRIEGSTRRVRTDGSTHDSDDGGSDGSDDRGDWDNGHGTGHDDGMDWEGMSYEEYKRVMSKQYGEEMPEEYGDSFQETENRENPDYGYMPPWF